MARNNSYQKGSVRLHGNEWTLRYREFNHSTRKWTTKRVKLGVFKSIKAALKAAEPIMAQVNERNNNPRNVFSETTFGEFIAGRWKAYTVSAKYQPSTLDSHSSLIKRHISPFFGTKKLRVITPGDISDFLDSLYGNVSANTHQHLYGLLHLMFDLALQYDLIEQSPVRPKLHKPEIRQTEKPTLTAAQIRSVLAELTEQEQLFVLLLSVTGTRMGEAMALCWIDFDAARLELLINHTVYRNRLKSPKTESSRRPIRLHPAIAALLVAHREQSRFKSDTDFIFCRSNGKPLNPTAMRRHLYEAMDKAKIERRKGQFGFHIFRHSAGSLLYAKTRDLKLVQGTLGHSDISITGNLYVHLTDRVIGEGAELLTEEILGNCDQIVTTSSKMVS